jgi:hypothetical protein
MGINKESSIEAELQVGPTENGMVRIFVAGAGVEIPMDFSIEEAHEIAEEILSAAQQAGASSKGEKSNKSEKKAPKGKK